MRGAEEAGRVEDQAISSVGSDIGGAITKYQDKQDAIATTNAFNDINQATPDLYANAETAVKNADPNDANFVKDYTDNTLAPAQDAIKAKYADASDKVQRSISEELTRQSSSLQMHLHGLQADYAGKAAVDNAQLGTDALSATAATNPETLQTLLDQSDRAAQAMSGAVPTALIPSYAAKQRSTLADTAATALIGKLEGNPAATVQDAQGVRDQILDPNGPYVKNLTGEQINAVTRKLDSFKDTQGGVQAALIKQQFPLAMTAIDNGGDPAQAKAMLDKYTALAKTKDELVDAAGMQRDLDYHTQYGAVIQDTKQKPDTQINAELADVHQQWLSATTDEDRNRIKATETAMTKARDDRDRAFHQDPSTYAIQNNGVVSARASDFAKAPSPQTFNAYATASSTYQRQLYPGQVPKLTTQAMRDDLGASVQQLQSDPKATDAVGAKLAQWSQITGDKWVQVAHELHDDKILNDDQFVAAGLYQKPAGKVLAQTLLQASAMSGKDLYALHGVSNQKATEAAIPEVQSLAQSLGNTGPDGAALVGSTVSAIAHLIQVRGDPDEAHELAASVINDEFSFRGRNGSTTLRIPNQPNLDPDKIQSGTDRELSNVGNLNLVVPHSLSGLNAGDQRKNYVDRLQHDAVWYTNKDGSGAILYDIDSGDPVKEMSGKNAVPVERKWNQLMTPAPSNASDTMAQQNIQTYERMGSH